MQTFEHFFLQKNYVNIHKKCKFIWSFQKKVVILQPNLNFNRIKNKKQRQKYE